MPAVPSLQPIWLTEGIEAFHHRPITAQSALWIPDFGLEVALVLGSRQDRSVVDIDAAQQRGVTVTSRRSGGGAVLVSNEDLVWFDVVLKASDPRFTPDVRRSFDWLGDRLVTILDRIGAPGGTVHRDGLQHSEWSDLVCFAGLGPGEVMIDGRKVVGVSQRRSREAARFQVAILCRWNPARMVELLALTASERERAATDLQHVAAGVDVSRDEVLRVVIETLADEPAD